MTQEEKQLLLKDLCARLPYEVKTTNGHGILKLSPRTDVIYIVDNGHIPYLRPMSSMTKEELEECRATCKYRQTGQSVLDCATPQTIDYLISHYFDYRGLIPMGLALEAKEGMYKTE